MVRFNDSSLPVLFNQLTFHFHSVHHAGNRMTVKISTNQFNSLNETIFTAQFPSRCTRDWWNDTRSNWKLFGLVIQFKTNYEIECALWERPFSNPTDIHYCKVPTKWLRWVGWSYNRNESHLNHDLSGDELTCLPSEFSVLTLLCIKNR